MKFEYLLLADAAKNGPDGKLNVLGLGARIVTFESFPAGSPLTVLGSVTADASEAGEYDIEVAMVQPDGTREPMVQAKATVSSEVEDARVPTGISFVLGFLRPFRIEGVHSFEARVGDVTARYDFLVRLRREPSSEPASSAGSISAGTSG